MAVTRRAPARRAPPAARVHAGHIVVLVLLLSSCGLLNDDAFPPWLAYVEASAELGSLAADAGLGTTFEAAALELLESGGTSRLLVYLNSEAGHRLIALDPDTLAAVKVIEDDGYGFSRRISATTDGFVCGGALVDPTDLSLSPAPAAFDWSRTRAIEADDGGTPVNLVFVEDSESEATFFSYTAAWAETSAAARPYAPDLGSYYPIDVSAVGGSYALLARRNADWACFAADYAPASAFASAGIAYALQDDAVETTGPFPAADGRAWLTADGPVAYRRDDGGNGTNRLVRYVPGSGAGVGADATLAASWAVELDSIEFDDDDVRALGFDAGGDWWFALDRLSGRLYKLRTWWK